MQIIGGRGHSTAADSRLTTREADYIKLCSLSRSIEPIDIAWRAVMLILSFSFISGFVTYGGAGVAAPILPALSVQVEGHHHEGSAPQEGHPREGASKEEHAH